MRHLRSLLIFLAVLMMASAVFWSANRHFRSEELLKAEGRLSLYQSTVNAELERFSHLTYVLARDPFVISTATASNRSLLNERFRLFAEAAGLDAIYLMDAGGSTISSSNANRRNSFIGQNYGFRPYFRTALQGEQGRFYGIGTTTGRPGYFIAEAVRAQDGRVLGVVAIKIDLSTLQESWRDAGENVLLANHDGVILLASEPHWRYRSLYTLTQVQRDQIAENRQFPGQALAPLDWQTDSPTWATVEGANWMHLHSDDLPHDWEIHYFSSDDRAVARSWVVTGLVVVLASAVLILVQAQRARRLSSALTALEKEETALRHSNSLLEREIDERRRAEHRLKRTRAELESASRLAALGRLAASVSHELGQPIAALKNHIAAADISGTPLPSAIVGLADRMDGITRQLKFFARSDQVEVGKVDLKTALHSSLDLVAPNLKRVGVSPDLDLPQAACLVVGNQLRLEQVMVNLLRNALDAIEGEADPELRIRIAQTSDATLFEVADNGHGLGEATLSDLQEPFVTTRESGRGMGLGLAISAGIINDHNAHMEAMNRDSGGCLFRITFPREDAPISPKDL